MMHPISARRLLVGLLWLVAATAHGDQATPAQLEFFEREVRPLLANHCYECHSVGAKKLQAGLLLDSRDAILTGGDSGAAVEPGNPDDSLLITAVRYEDYEMPPKGKLQPAEIASLEQWVSMGAPWPTEQAPTASRVVEQFDWQQRAQEHWCWQPIEQSEPPTVSDSGWCRNPIDNFARAKLAAAGLTPAGEADRRTLIRRIYFDLIGLPPSPAQIDDFLRDDAEDAYEKVVDHLLRSPHFGEKWTRHWLDLVRYAETLGHEFDYPLHHAYRYRDYLIRAFNDDVPYDQLVREHLAGDLLDRPRRHPTERFNESVIGTGFWFLGEAIHAPTDVRADESDRVANQIDVMSKAFLGLTVACARCHDHKFDPIPAADYYALAGYLQSSRRQESLLDPHGTIERTRQQLEALYGQGNRRWQRTLDHPLDIKVVRAALVSLVQAETVDESLAFPAHPLFALTQLAKAGDNFVSQRDELAKDLRGKSDMAAAELDRTELFVDFGESDLSDWYLTGPAFAEEPTRNRDWQPYQPTLPLAHAGAVHSGLAGTKLQGVLRSPTFTLNHTRVHYRINADAARIRLIVDGYTMDEFNALLFGDITLEKVDTQGQRRWVTQQNDLYHYVGHRAHIEIIDNSDGFAALEEIRFSNDASPTAPPHPLNLAVLEDEGVESIDALLDGYASAIVASAAGDIDVTNWLVRCGLIVTPSAVVELRDAMHATNESLPAPMPVIALTDGDGENEHVFIRGSHKNLGPEVGRRTLLAMGGDVQPAPAHGSGRLDLARRMTDAANPLTARVAVNRLWHHLFGRGIVPTVDDFGRMGQPPSHPELLDWLADDFMRRKGWSLKQAIRQIVTSSTYRMSSHATADASLIAQVDPNNVLLHRAPIRRLPGEAIRDALLTLSGRLDPTMYGPSVRVHLTSFMDGRGRPKSGPLDGDGRRSLYIEVRRNFLSPMMLAFDTPSPFSAMGRRSNSNVPAQSLILMNDPFVIEQARSWAQALLAEESLGDDQSRVNQAFEMAFAQLPTQQQADRIGQFLRDALEDADREEVWTDLCHMLINMKPFIFLN